MRTNVLRPLFEMAIAKLTQTGEGVRTAAYKYGLAEVEQKERAERAGRSVTCQAESYWSFLSEEVRGWLRADPRAQDNAIGVHGDEVIITWRQGELDLGDLQGRADFLCDLLDRVR